MSEQDTPPGPYEVEVKAGYTYYWCTCGKSADQPFCDGSHQGSKFEPLAYTAPEDASVWLCGCKRTGRPPFCDGSHNRE